MEDFDYIEDGGFLIECSDGQVLGVTAAQAEQMKLECEFIRNCFRHGTIESAGTLRKPDWPIAIARHLVEVLTKGKTTVRSLSLYEQLIKAGDQALIDLRLCSLVNYLDITSKADTLRFSSLVDPSNYRFQLRGNFKSSQWQALLGMGILLYRTETNFAVKVGKQDFELDSSSESSSSQSVAMARRKLDSKISDFRVHTDKCIRAVRQISSVLSGSEEQSKPSDERFSIYFETTITMPTSHHELIDRLAGGEAYIRTCADASVSSEGYTVAGSFDVLHRALQPLYEIKEKPPLCCSLRVDNPTPDTLGRLLNACRKATDFPASLGLDAKANRYFCKKTVSDMKCILEYLADFSTTAVLSGDFLLWETSNEVEPF